MQAGEDTRTEDETRAVAAYYKVLNNMLSVFDLEKLYIPPQLDENQGLYGNQLLCERDMLEGLKLQNPAKSHLLDMGCGRGRVAYHLATQTGGQVSGYNIDANQLESADLWARECNMAHRLHFKVGNHHEPLDYASETFDGSYSVQAVWPFFKKEELDDHAREMHRVLKPGARYSCSEYHHASFRLGQPRACVSAKCLSPYPGGHAVHVSSRRLRGAERAGFELFYPRHRRVPRGPCATKARLILGARKAIRAPEKHRCRRGGGISRPTSGWRRGLDHRRKGQDCRFKLENHWEKLAHGPKMALGMVFKLFTFKSFDRFRNASGIRMGLKSSSNHARVRHPVSTTSSPLLLAKKGILVVPMRAILHGPPRYRCSEPGMK